MENDSIKQLADRLGQSTDRLVNVGNRLIKSTNKLGETSERLVDSIVKNSESQEKHQKAIVWLTVVIAVATVVYTCVTIWSTRLQYQDFQLNHQPTDQPTLENTVTKNT